MLRSIFRDATPVSVQRRLIQLHRNAAPATGRDHGLSQDVGAVESP